MRALVVHGGAGAERVDERKARRMGVQRAAEAGWNALRAGKSALDAVVAAVVVLENDPSFNAGLGSVLTEEGAVEMDASLMEGAALRAGAVGAVAGVKNPIKLARAIMEKSVHVMFAREGAEEFAREQGLEIVKPDYFRTEKRWKEYEAALAKEKIGKKSELPHEFKYGTVGAVALDSKGNLAAGTSTGGMTLKRYGRVGDAPIIGAGTFADNNSCAVSSTGWGEFFIRLTIARDICAQVEYADKSVADAANDVIHNRLQKAGGDGGVIVLDRQGNYAMTFNSAGMFRGVKKQGAEPSVAIYKDAGQ
jgi:beta-aspartyl-peptidase (threonine type)